MPYEGDCVSDNVNVDRCTADVVIVGVVVLNRLSIYILSKCTFDSLLFYYFSDITTTNEGLIMVLSVSSVPVNDLSQEGNNKNVHRLWG